MQCDLSAYQNKRICVALSGGNDSVALAHYLFTKRKAYGIELSAVNCEHGVRGEESLLDSDFVKEFCRERKIPLFSFSCNCVERAAREKVSLETACRNFRYECFEKLLSEKKVDCIATAHHAMDNAETLLFRLCRGTSLSGMRGITDRPGYIRPFLNLSKREILSYLQENNLSCRHDSTNDDESYTRNALRNRILPELEKEIPGATENISRFASLAASDDEFLYELSAPHAKQTDTDEWTITECPKPLFYRAALTALKNLGAEKDYTQTHLNDVFELLKKPTSSRVSLPFGIRAERERDGICLYREKTPVFDEKPFRTGESVLGEFTIVVDKTPQGLAFDINKLPKDCLFRFRKDGDRITKFGGGTKKLKEYFNDKKIPLRKRDEIPLIAQGEKIFCAVGVDISDSIKTEPSSDVWYIRYYHQGEK